MAVDRIAVAQRGVVLADVVREPAARKRAARGERAARKPAKAAGVLTGPFLSPGTLTRAERLRLIDGIEAVIDGVYTHLPLKRARYGTDPVQRLRILRSQVDQLTDDAFHLELADLHDPPSRCSHALRRSGRAGQQGRRVAVPGRDDRHRRAHRPTSSPRSGMDWRRPSSPGSCSSTGTVSRSTAPCSGTASPRSAGGRTASARGRRRA